jgi:hypothetical protein
MEHEYDGNAPGDENQEREHKLNPAGNEDTGILPHERCREWTSCDTREHRKPPIRDGQWPLAYEKCQTADTRDTRPYPSDDPSEHQSKFLHVVGA